MSENVGFAHGPCPLKRGLGRLRMKGGGHKEPLIPGWPRGRPGYGEEAVQAKLLPVKIGNSQGVGLLNANEMQTIRKAQNTQCLGYCYL